jgi:hypothetical protein
LRWAGGIAARSMIKSSSSAWAVPIDSAAATIVAGHRIRRVPNP